MVVLVGPFTQQCQPLAPLSEGASDNINFNSIVTVPLLSNHPLEPSCVVSSLNLKSEPFPAEYSLQDIPNIKQEPISLLNSKLYTMDEALIDPVLRRGECASDTSDSESDTGKDQPRGKTYTVEEQDKIISEEVWDIVLERRKKYKANKGTNKSYPRHVKRYETWWEANEKQRVADEAEVGNVWIARRAHPITAEKAALFLDYESKRPKRTRDGKDISNTRVGRSSIQQTISALQNYRSDHQRDDLYRDCPEVHISLRDNIEIREIERSAKADEPERQKESQEMKAQGVAHQTFTLDELALMSNDHLSNPNGRAKINIHSSIRDRAMLLFTTSMALRGDNTRSILLSDLFMRDVVLPDIGLDHHVKALFIFSNQGKTNVDGHIDHHTTFRHRDPKLCAIGALALYLFSEFQVLTDFERPKFAPIFNVPNAGPYGFREWYNIVLYHRHDNRLEEMSAENHRARVNAQKTALMLTHLKATHAGRGFSATNAVAYGASQDDVRALGIWSQPGSFSIYNRALPVNAMIASAGYNGNKQESYFLARDILEPPAELLSSIFPWIEEEQEAYNVRLSQSGTKARDESLKCLLELLLYLRKILLQDAAILYHEFPNAPIFSFHPFNTPLFQSFSSTSAHIIEEAEYETRQRLKEHELEEKYVRLLKGFMETIILRIDQQELRSGYDKRQVSHRLSNMENHLSVQCHIQAQTTGSKKRKAAFEELINHASSQLDIVIPSPAVSARPLRVKAARHQYNQPSPIDNSEGISISRAPEPLTIDTQTSMSSSISHFISLSEPPRSTTSSTISPIKSHHTQSINSPSASTTGLFYSRKGNVYSYITFPIDSDPLKYDIQMKALYDLEDKILPEVLKQYKFFWYSDKKRAEWLPDFLEIGFWKPSGRDYPETIEQLWQEFTEGIDGRMSIQDLEAYWGARWKQNKSSIKTEYSRRIKVIKLIKELGSKPGWDTAIALKFLQTTWPIDSSSPKPHLKHLRRFIDYLQSKDMNGYLAVVDSARIFDLNTIL